jgi:hypothetical protein
MTSIFTDTGRTYKFTRAFNLKTPSGCSKLTERRVFQQLLSEEGRSSGGSPWSAAHSVRHSFASIAPLSASPMWFFSSDSQVMLTGKR